MTFPLPANEETRAGDEFVVLAINAMDDIAEVIPARLKGKLDEYNAASGKPYRGGHKLGNDKRRS